MIDIILQTLIYDMEMLTEMLPIGWGRYKCVSWAPQALLVWLLMMQCNTEV